MCLKWNGIEIGRGVGGGVSALAAHHLDVIRVFVGAALITLAAACVWFLWLHLCCCKPLRTSCHRCHCCSCRCCGDRDAKNRDSPQQHRDAINEFPKGTGCVYWFALLFCATSAIPLLGADVLMDYSILFRIGRARSTVPINYHDLIGIWLAAALNRIHSTPFSHVMGRGRIASFLLLLLFVCPKSE